MEEAQGTVAVRSGPAVVVTAVTAADVTCPLEVAAIAVVTRAAIAEEAEQAAVAAIAVVGRAVAEEQAGARRCILASWLSPAR